MSKRINDARLWAQMLTPLQDAGLDYATADRTSRQLVALVRRERAPGRRTFAPGDPLPSPPPARVADVDGEIWEHQDAGNGCYRMCESDRERLADSTEDVEGVRLWPFLLDEWGPLTEILVPDTACPDCTCCTAALCEQARREGMHCARFAAAVNSVLARCPCAPG